MYPLTLTATRSMLSRTTNKLRLQSPLKKPKTLVKTRTMNEEAIQRLKPQLTTDKILVAFDFDKTLIDVNSDTHVLKLLPNLGKEAEQFRKLQWISYMQKVFDLLCTNNIRPAQLFECLGNVSWTKGMAELVKELSEAGHDLIIISDCNSVFINAFLGAKGMEQCFKAIYTNPAEFDGKGCLKIKMFHQQNWCELSAVNLCKGNVLDEFIKIKSVGSFRYKFVVYVGDGMNDYCPMLRLRASDVAMPRLGYACHKQISIEDRPRYKVKAKVAPWNDGFDVRDVIYSML